MDTALRPVHESGKQSQRIETPGTVVKIFANFFSYLFHPVFIPLYVTAFLLYIHPKAFSGFSPLEKTRTMIIVGQNIVFYPLFSVLLLKALGFIESLYLRSQKDRIIPYIVSGIFFFWAYMVFKQQTQYPPMLTSYVFGIFLASSAALIANIYFKVSMHAIGTGGLTAFFLVIAKTNSMLMTWPLSVALLITGFVCTSRLLLRSHDQKDIYTGLLIGAITQFAAAAFIM